MSPYLNLRLRQLEDNVKKDLALLDKYEDVLRDEEDPRRQSRNKRAIQQLRESAIRYKQEYDELQMQVASESPAEMQDVANQLQQMDKKLNLILTGQAAVYSNLNQLRQALLTRYNASEQRIISVIVERVDQTQLIAMQVVLDALETNRVSEAEMQHVLASTQRMLEVVKERSLALPQGHEVVAEVIEAPALDANHRLKVSIPLIPFLIDYEAELQLGSGINLKAGWESLVARLGRK